ncbi:hypothetical protein R3P38DRAFT_3364007 [Favolaschia claudopus]|uniref:Uncharacterized protein n=1 Tax=Favolaschia claudopus TaxID=2862362 RepID=A0AAW0AI81_9AGAR
MCNATQFDQNSLPTRTPPPDPLPPSRALNIFKIPQDTPACLQMHICTTSIPRLRLTQRRFPDRSAVGCLVPMVSDTLAEVSIIPSPTYNGYHPGYLPASRFNEGGGNGASKELLLETSAKYCYLRRRPPPTSANLRRQGFRAQPPLRHRADAVGNSYIIRQRFLKVSEFNSQFYMLAKNRCTKQLERQVSFTLNVRAIWGKEEQREN